jgi:hypothetical protein
MFDTTLPRKINGLSVSLLIFKSEIQSFNFYRSLKGKDGFRVHDKPKYFLLIWYCKVPKSRCQCKLIFDIYGTKSEVGGKFDHETLIEL